MANQIVVDSGANSGQRLWLRAGQTIQVGRTELGDCCIRDDELMSRLHFAIDYEQGVCRLRDLGSRNGTFVNGKLTRSANLNNGDTILAGKTKFTVTLDQSASSESPITSTDINWEPVKDQPVADAATPEAARTIVDAPSAPTESVHGAQASPPPPTQAPATYSDDETMCVDSAEYMGSPIVPQQSSPPPVASDSPGMGSMNSPIVMQSHSDSTYYDDSVTGADLPAEPEGSSSASKSPAATSLRKSLQETVGPNGISVLAPVDRHSRPLDVARVLVDNPNFYLLLNINRMEPAAQSYFTSPIQGSKFSRIASHLILISKEDAIDNFEVFCRAIGRNALIGLISNTGKDELAQSLTQRMQFFNDPASLTAELSRSAPEARKMIFAMIDALFVEGGEDTMWCMMLNPESSLGWSDIGF